MEALLYQQIACIRDPLVRYHYFQNYTARMRGMSDGQQDAEQEFLGAQGAVELRHIRWLVAQGVKQGMFDCSVTRSYTFGVAPIEVLKDKSWQLTVAAREALIVPIDDADGEIIDLAAFYPQAPELVFRRFNHSPIIGASWLAHLRHYNHWLEPGEKPKPLHVHLTVLDLMRADWQGVVVLDWRAFLPLVFHSVAEIHCDNEPLARRLDDALRRPLSLPQILVAE